MDDATAESLDLAMSKLEFYDTRIHAESSPFQHITIRCLAILVYRVNKRRFLFMSRCNGDDTGAVLSVCRQYVHLEYFENSEKANDFIDSDVVLLYLFLYCAWYLKFAPSSSRIRIGGCFVFLFLQC